MKLESFKYPEPVERPRNRMDCLDSYRPCPYVGCKYNLYLDVNPATGSIKYNFPWLEPNEMGNSCVLDLANKGNMTLESVGAIMNMTRERVRQVEDQVILRFKTKPNPEVDKLREYENEVGDRPYSEGRL
jgi:hypothetical protein